MVGLSGFEPLTSRLSGVRSNQLSYRPVPSNKRPVVSQNQTAPERVDLRVLLLRKEVIQPHLPVRLPCYDLTPLIEHTFGASLP